MLLVDRTDGLEADLVGEAGGGGLGPGGEFGAGPLKAMVAVAELACGQGREQGVVLAVGGSDEDVLGPREFEDDAFQGGEAGGSRCSMTSTSAAASKPARRLSR